MINILLQFHIRRGASFPQANPSEHEGDAEAETQATGSCLSLRQTGAALGGHSGDPLYQAGVPPLPPRPLLRSLAASDSPQWSATSQPRHCKQSEYVERILTGASKASGPACDSSSLTSFFLLRLLGATAFGDILAGDGFTVHIFNPGARF